LRTYLIILHADPLFRNRIVTCINYIHAIEYEVKTNLSCSK